MELRGEAEPSENKIPITVKVSYNQSLGHRKFKRSHNVKPLLLAMHSPKAHSVSRQRRCSKKSPMPKNSYGIQGKYGWDDKGMRVI